MDYVPRLLAPYLKWMTQYTDKKLNQKYVVGVDDRPMLETKVQLQGPICGYI